ncbi:MAG: hypothetical protein AAGH79_12340 [Bacteroidota bacterium]
MHDIEPHYQWRDKYIASEDSRSPFYQRQYNEFQFTQKIYNYYIHPQWDAFGSPTLYSKILFTDYDEGYTIIELLGEWNDALQNDIMFLKRNIIDQLAGHRVNKFLIICDNVLNFHGSDDCYYEEWYEDVRDEDGWICFANLLDHVEDEMRITNIHHFINLGGLFNQLSWRTQKPQNLFLAINMAVEEGETRLLP